MATDPTGNTSPTGSAAPAGTERTAKDGSPSGSASGGGTPPGAGGQPAPSASDQQPMRGAYMFKDATPEEVFNLGLKPRHPHPVPADQAKLAKDVYETKNILKLLHSEGRFGTTPEQQSAYAEFIHRVKEAAAAGCVGEDDEIVETALAADALAQILADILRRIGRPLAFRYLDFLALWALAGAGIGLVIAAGHFTPMPLIQSMSQYGWVVVGAMAGGWFAVATRRWQIGFEEIPDFLDIFNEPSIRLLFVAVVALVLALFLDLEVLNTKLGNADLAGFARQSGRRVEIALLVGFIAGLSERAISKELVDRIGKALPQS